MSLLSKQDLLSLEQYSGQRQDFRAKVMAEKKLRVLPVGPDISLHFENRLIMQYQIQEMLRVEKIFEAEAIQEELDTYNPMIPDGSNWKATMMIEIDDPEVRKPALEKMMGIEDKTWVEVAGFDRVYAIADEDLERENDTKTSSVHFMRFELTDDMVAAAKNGVDILTGIDHPAYTHSLDLSTDSADSLRADLV